MISCASFALYRVAVPNPDSARSHFSVCVMSQSWVWEKDFCFLLDIMYVLCSHTIMSKIKDISNRADQRISRISQLVVASCKKVARRGAVFGIDTFVPRAIICLSIGGLSTFSRKAAGDGFSYISYQKRIDMLNSEARRDGS